MRQWYYTKMGLQQGPVPEDELRQKIRRGEIGESNLLWREGMGDWLPFDKIPELSGGASEVTGGQGVPPLPLPPSGGLRNSVPMAQSPVYQAGLSGQNVPSYLAHSVVALVVSLVMAGVVCLPVGLPFAIVALVYASKVDRLQAQGDTLGAGASSKNAKLWMIISFALSGLSILGLIGFFTFVIFQAQP